METFNGTANVAAPVLRKFAVSQLRRGGMLEKEKDTATQSMPYRALNEDSGRAPLVTHIVSTTLQERDDNDNNSPCTKKLIPAMTMDINVPRERASYLSDSQDTNTVITKATA